MEYPFKPKSTVHMENGQFWPIRLSDGEWACGMVLSINKESRREFVAGLVDWRGAEEPSASDIEGRKIIEQGVGHIKMISEGYGRIIGRVSPDHAPSPCR